MLVGEIAHRARRSARRDRPVRRVARDLFAERHRRLEPRAQRPTPRAAARRSRGDLDTGANALPDRVGPALRAGRRRVGQGAGQRRHRGAGRGSGRHRGPRSRAPRAPRGGAIDLGLGGAEACSSRQARRGDARRVTSRRADRAVTPRRSRSPRPRFPDHRAHGQRPSDRPLSCGRRSTRPSSGAASRRRVRRHRVAAGGRGTRRCASSGSSPRVRATSARPGSHSPQGLRARAPDARPAVPRTRRRGLRRRRGWPKATPSAPRCCSVRADAIRAAEGGGTGGPGVGRRRITRPPLSRSLGDDAFAAAVARRMRRRPATIPRA